MSTSSETSRVKIIVFGVLFWIILLGLLATLLTAVIRAAVLVDQIPGGDAGLATTSDLEFAYATINWSFPALAGVIAIGVLVYFIDKFRGRKLM